jgi:hypothetical protein
MKHGLAATTCGINMDLQYGHAAWKCRVDMDIQHGVAIRTGNMGKNAAWTGSMNLHYAHAA